MATTTTDILLRAADLIADRGWAQGSLADAETGGLCLRGAMKVAANEAQVPTTFVAMAFNQWLLANEGTADVPGWNDEPCRSAEDVMLALKRCAIADPGLGGVPS